MAPNNHEPPGLGRLARTLGRTALGAVRNRAELLSVEWQEERAHLIELQIWTVIMLFFALMTMVLVTATIIFLVPTSARLYVVAGLALLYLAGGVVAWLRLRQCLQHKSFPESLGQLRKDTAWVESLE
jgi:uncharacterized membrane protein YqjE